MNFEKYILKTRGYGTHKCFICRTHHNLETFAQAQPPARDVIVIAHPEQQSTWRSTISCPIASNRCVKCHREKLGRCSNDPKFYAENPDWCDVCIWARLETTSLLGMKK